MQASESDTLGYDVVQVTDWVGDHVPGLDPPFRWTRFHAGHSNLTCLLEDAGGRRAVIRRPPLGELQPRAHDMHREFRIIEALWPTGVPVAEPLAYCGDPSVTGAHFFLMGFVAGRALPSSAEIEAHLPVERRRTTSESHADVLAALHVLDPDAAGLGDLGAREDYVGRQLRAWYRSWTTSAEAAGYDDPRVHELHAWLDAHKPPQGPARIAHGDYGLHNCLIGEDGRVAAVVDWEVCALGDPLADLAYVLNRWSGDGDVGPRGGITMPAGFLSRQAMADRYQAATGADLSGLGYYVAFNHWKSACIVHGVYTRYRRGQKSTDDVDLSGFRAMIGTSLASAQSSVESL